MEIHLPTLRDLLTNAPGSLLHDLRVIARIAKEALESSPRLPITPHTFDHSQRVEMRAANMLCEAKAQDALNWYELYMLILVCWFHDAGMVFFSDNESVEDIRREHRIRCRQFLDTYLSENLSHAQRGLIADIAMTHLEPSVDRLISEQWVECSAPSVLRIRPRLLASILRIADASEITQSRISWRVAKHTTMNEESTRHWQRHLNINAIFWQGARMPITLLVDCEYGSYESKQFLKDSIDSIDAELKLAAPHLKEAGILISPLCERRIRERNPDRQISWSVLPRSVYKLLTEGMYDSKTVFIRELIQNSLDAIKIRHRVMTMQFKPQIEVAIFVDSNPSVSSAQSYRNSRQWNWYGRGRCRDEARQDGQFDTRFTASSRST